MILTTGYPILPIDDPFPGVQYRILEVLNCGSVVIRTSLKSS